MSQHCWHAINPRTLCCSRCGKPKRNILMGGEIMKRREMLANAVMGGIAPLLS